MTEAKRIEDLNDKLTEQERRDRARQRDLAADTLLRRHADELAGFDAQAKAKMGSHWSEKVLENMTERDWRIFREDFDIRIQGGRATLPLRYGYVELTFSHVYLFLLSFVLSHTLNCFFTYPFTHPLTHSLTNACPLSTHPINRYWSEANFPTEVMEAIQAVGYEKPPLSNTLYSTHPLNTPYSTHLSNTLYSTHHMQNPIPHTLFNTLFNTPFHMSSPLPSPLSPLPPLSPPPSLPFHSYEKPSPIQRQTIPIIPSPLTLPHLTPFNPPTLTPFNTHSLPPSPSLPLSP